MRETEVQMRRNRSLARIIKRKVKQGRPGRMSNAPAPTFSWDDVTKASKKSRDDA